MTWLRHFTPFGPTEECMAVFERGLAARLGGLGEEGRRDAADYYSQCRRWLWRSCTAE